MGRLVLAFAFAYIVAVGLGMIPKAYSADMQNELMSNPHVGCIEQAVSGYGSGMEQRWCELNYPGLPSPFTFRCVEYIDKGFPTRLDALACILHFGTYERDRWARTA